MSHEMSLFAVPDLPLIEPGDDLGKLIVDRLEAAGRSLTKGDILVIAQKVVSKAEGRLVRLNDVEIGSQALSLAEVTGKDPRIVQVVLDDSRSVIRAQPGLLIVEQKGGWISAHGGMDRSNVASREEDEMVALLPLDGDASAEKIQRSILDSSGFEVGVLINDSHGRPWRVGTVGVCIGCAGLPPLWNQRGLQDLFGYELVGSEECIADELAAAASLLMGQSDEGRPAVLIRGYRPPELPEAPATTIQRNPKADSFR